MLFFHNSNAQQNSPSVELWWEKIKGNLRVANKEQSMHIRRAIAEPSMDFKKGNMEPSMHFGRANMEDAIVSGPAMFRYISDIDSDALFVQVNQ